MEKLMKHITFDVDNDTRSNKYPDMSAAYRVPNS